MIAGLLLCEQHNSPGQWIALVILGLLPAACGAYWVLRAGHLATKSRARGYRSRPWMGPKLYAESPAVYVVGGLVFGGFGLLALIGSLVMRNAAC